MNENTTVCLYSQDALHMALDTTRQFITLSVGGIGFVTGISYISPTVFSTYVFWWSLFLFGLSVGFGLLFCMRATGEVHCDKNYNVYSPALRVCSATQIFLFLIGIILLCSSLRPQIYEEKSTVTYEKLTAPRYFSWETRYGEIREADRSCQENTDFTNKIDEELLYD